MTGLDAPVAPARADDLYGPDGSRVYDRLVAADRSEVDDLLAIARAAGENVLELACGAGRITLPLVAAGLQVCALDLSPSMLELLQDKVIQRPSLRRRAPELVQASMADFGLERRFDSVLLGTCSVTLLGADERTRCFGLALAHLRDGGVFALTNVELAEGADHRVLQLGADVRYEERLDPRARVRHVQVTTTAGRAAPAGGTGTSTSTFTSTVAVLQGQQLVAELEEAGFVDVRLQVLASHDDGRVHQLISGRREGAS